ncbi:hypothetical protein C0991_010886 [Blastosporella zonata]|nr:hypothetical protein C0991_010886 [Blastosporella zonata]
MAKVSPVRSDIESGDEQSPTESSPNKKGKTVEEPMDVDDDEAGEDGDEEPEYEIEQILDAKRGAFPEGRMGFLVKWKGYDESENSWVDEKDAGNAEALIEDYWKRNPKKAGRKSESAKTPKKPRKSAADEEVVESASAATKKRGRKSQPDKEISDSRVTKKSKNNGVAAKNDDASHPFDEVVVGDMAGYMNIQSWEHLVGSIDTIERAQDNSLRVYFSLTSGDRVVEDSKLCAQRFPQKASSSLSV